MIVNIINVNTYILIWSGLTTILVQYTNLYNYYMHLSLSSPAHTRSGKMGQVVTCKFKTKISPLEGLEALIS